MPRRSKLTMDDVARAARVSKQTVSAVINNKSGISEKTRARVREIITRLDYHPNLLAGSLRAQRSFTVGVLIPSITNPFFPEFVRGIEDVAQKHGYSLFLCNSDDDQQKAFSYLQLLRKHRIAGLVGAFEPRQPESHSVLQSLLAHRVPVVLLGSKQPDERIVLLTEDDQQGTFL